MKSIVAVPILCMSMVVPSVAWSAPFPDAGVDRTTSLGQFKIRLTKEWGIKLNRGNNCPNLNGTNCVLISPALADYNTIIGRSDPHKDGDSTDIGGAEVCKQGSNSSCNQKFTAKVKDSDFSASNPFEGPVGTNEIHTQIIYFNLTLDPKGDRKRCPNASTTDETAVRAGSKAPDQPRSIGEIESNSGINNGTNDFPAQSFFNIFVEVDLDFKPNTANDGVITLYNKKPLVIQNGDLKNLPPRVVYTHENSSGFAPLIYEKSNDKPFGWLTLAGHGIKYDCNRPGDLEEFTKIFENMKENTKLEPIKALSVSLDTFTATAANGKVTINWTTGTETNNAGFTLWRATPKDGQCSLNPSNYQDVRQVQPLVYSKAQDGVLGASYSEEDQNAEAGVTYCYGLEDVDYDGKRTFHVDKIISATLN